MEKAAGHTGSTATTASSAAAAAAVSPAAKPAGSRGHRRAEKHTGGAEDGGRKGRTNQERGGGGGDAKRCEDACEECGPSDSFDDGDGNDGGDDGGGGPDGLDWAVVSEATGGPHTYRPNTPLRFPQVESEGNAADVRIMAVPNGITRVQFVRPGLYVVQLRVDQARGDLLAPDSKANGVRFDVRAPSEPEFLGVPVDFFDVRRNAGSIAVFEACLRVFASPPQTPRVGYYLVADVSALSGVFPLTFLGNGVVSLAVRRAGDVPDDLPDE